jgi:hypothetical protein
MKRCGRFFSDARGVRSQEDGVLFEYVGFTTRICHFLAICYSLLNILD